MTDSQVFDKSIELVTAYFQFKERGIAIDAGTVVDVLIAAMSIMVIFICLCRIARLDHRTTRPVIGCAYILLLTGAFCVGGAPWLFEQRQLFGITEVRTGALIFIVTVIAHLLSGWREWIGKQPRFTQSGRMPLETSEPHDATQ